MRPTQLYPRYSRSSALLTLAAGAILATLVATELSRLEAPLRQNGAAAVSISLLGTALVLLILALLAAHRHSRTDSAASYVAGIAEAVPAIIVVLNPDGSIDYINPAFERLTGYRLDDVRGKDWFDTFLPERDRARIRSLFRAATNGVPTKFNVNPILTRSGEERQIEWHDRLWRGAAGHPDNLVALGIDITEHKRREWARQKSEEIFRSLVESAQDPMFTTDAQGRYLYVNRAAAARLGRTPAEIAGRAVDDFFPPDTAALHREIISRALQTGESTWAEVCFVMSGTKYWSNVFVQPIRDADGAFTTAVVIARDITDRKRAENALRQNEERLRQVVRLSHIGIFDHDHVTGEIYWSAEQRQIYGWGPDEPVVPQAAGGGRGTWDLVHPLDRERLAAAVKHAHESEDGLFDIEYRIILRDGSVRWVSTRSQSFFEGAGAARRPVRTIGAVQDITERKAAERQLLLAQTSIEKSSVAIFWIDPSGTLTYANQQACASLGRTREELIGSHVWDFDPDFSAERWAEAWRSLRAHGSRRSESYHRRRDGTLFPVEILGNYVVFEGEAQVFVFTQDITERRRAAQELALFRYCIDRASEAIFWNNASGGFDYVNDQACRSLGYSREEVLRLKLWDIDNAFSPDQWLRRWERWERAPGDSVSHTESTHRRKDGTVFPIEALGQHMHAAGGRSLHVGYVRDITERKEAERALRESEERLRQVALVYNIGVFDHDHLTGSVYWSPELRECLDVGPTEAAEVSSFVQMIHPEDRERVEAARERAFDPAGDGRYTMQHRIVTRDGAIKWLDTRSKTFFAAEAGAVCPTRTVGAMVDITDRMNVDEALRASERRLREAQSIASIGNWELDLRTNRLSWSDEVYRLFEVDAGDFGATYEALLARVHPQDRHRVDAEYRRSLRERVPFRITHRLLGRDGRVKYLEARCETDFDADGTPVRSRGTVQDVTVRVEAEEALRASVREKGILLREVHHRVKNNLQIIASLLHFQAKRVRDPEDLAAFKEGRDRLRAMILVHEKLYKARDFSHIDLGSYIQSLVRDLQQSYTAAVGERVSVHVRTDQIALPIEAALPCGMIVCELLTNSIKYAFPGEGRGEIHVTLAADADRVRLVVSDDGAGLPADFDPAHVKTFGWRLIRNLADQLGASLTLGREPGTRVALEFQRDRYHS